MAHDSRYRAQLEESCRLIALELVPCPANAPDWFTRAGADGRKIPGSSPISSTIFGR